MMNATTTEALCRQLPQLGRLLEDEHVRELMQAWPRDFVVDTMRRLLQDLREQAVAGVHSEASLRAAIEQIPVSLSKELQRANRPSLRRLINATGVLLQTNLGRAPLSEAALHAMEQVARGYCNLEFDLKTGKRGRRDMHAEELILRLLSLRSAQPMDSKAATVVNNCAAATFLALNSLAEGGEVIVSRGELVEIGGGFRVPDILRKSGAVLREVGTTNRTRLSDYAAAITPETRLILRVHRSNFRIEGFTQQPRIEELVALGAKASVPVFEDQGTGCVVNLEDFGIREESSWVRSTASGVALLSASGDKLLGGPQCGILVGERALIERIRMNALARAFRPDKLTFAALQATLLAYIAGQEETIPVIHMLRTSAGELRERCDALAEILRERGWLAETVAVRSVVGGGTTPGATLSGFAVALRHPAMTESELSSTLRCLDPPVIARTRRGRVLLDLRTVSREDDAVLLRVLTGLEPRA
jgi:L-seryl-tRNA(Ser) seleniumtransferase